MKKFLVLFSALAVVAFGGAITKTWAPAGGCCLPDGTCADDMDFPACSDAGGEWFTEVTCADLVCGGEEPAECRVTGGGVDTTNTWDGSEAKGNYWKDSGVDRYTFGGQAGAPTGAQPQPYGEWTHHQKRGPSGTFVFHAGTASAPPGTEIDWIGCSDPGWCVQARPAPAKQIDFEGVGTFKMIRKPPASLAHVVPGETFHWFSVHIEDLGEPGRAGKVEPASENCPLAGSHGTLADCDCPDFYHIRIHATEDPGSPVAYEVFGYITGGNLQIHPPVGESMN